MTKVKPTKPWPPPPGDPQDKTGGITIHGGIVHCPCTSRSWTVEHFRGVLKLYCTKCKRCFILIKDELVNAENIK